MVDSHEERGPRYTGRLAAAIRAGHAAKGTVYAATAAFALWRAMAGAEGAGGSRAAFQAIAEAPFGMAAIAILAAGLAAFAFSRIALAILDPEGAGWRGRARNLVRAAFHVALVIFVAHLLFGGDITPAEEPTRLARVLARPRGRWTVSAFGAVLLALGVRRLVRPRPGPGASDAAPAPERGPGLPMAVASAARVARATILVAAGGGLLYAAAIRAPTAGPSWLGGVLGTCLVALAANEWARARYLLPEKPF